MLHYIVATCVLMASALAAPQSALEVDYARSYIVAKAKKGGLLRFLGHEHGVVAGAWSAAVVFDEQDLDAARISVEVPAPELLIDTAEARTLAGVDPDGPNDEQVAEIRAKMLSDEQLDVEQFPLIRFDSSRVRMRGEGGLQLDGTLTIHGIPREVAIDAALERRDGGYVVSGGFEIKLRDFGIEPVSIGGVVKVSNDLEIKFEIYAVPVDNPGERRDGKDPQD